MVPVIIGLLLTGTVLVLASFIFGGSFSSKPEKKMLTEEEIERLVERRFHEVKYKLDDEAEKSADQIKDQTERELEKLSNEKIMAVNEYSDQVMDQINKNHEEVMFLYSMLSDKQKELDHAMERLNHVRQQTHNEEMLAGNQQQTEEKEQAQPVQQRTASPEKIFSQKQHSTQADRMKTPGKREETAPSNYDSRKEIIELYRQGMSSLEIAQKLHLGIGEVRLVLELQKGRL